MGHNAVCPLKVNPHAGTLAFSLAYSTLKMRTMCPSESSVEIQGNTRRCIPEDCTLHIHRCENPKFYRILRAGKN
jgi:hypothetical protein